MGREQRRCRCQARNASGAERPFLGKDENPSMTRQRAARARRLAPLFRTRSTHTMDVQPTREQLSSIRKLVSPELDLLYDSVIPSIQQALANAFFSELNDERRTIAKRLCLVTWTISKEILENPIVPKVFQLKASIASITNQDAIINVGTGYGKTLCMILPHLLDPDAVSIVISPLKRLQLLQVKEFEKWGISCVAINQNTPREDKLWQVSLQSFIGHGTIHGVGHIRMCIQGLHRPAGAATDDRGTSATLRPLPS